VTTGDSVISEEGALPGWSLGPRTRIAVVAAVALLVAAAALAIREQQRADEAGHWVRHTLVVLQQVQGLRSGVLRAETAQRGYLLTGEPSYLEPYQGAGDEIARDLAELQSLTSDNPSQQSRLAELRPLVSSKLDELAQTIALRRDRGLDAALAVVQTHLGQETMERVQERLDGMRDAESALLASRLEDRATAAHRARIASLSLASLALVFLVGTIFSLSQTSYARLLAERAARESEREARTTQERLRVTLQSIGDAVIATDARGAVVFMNPVAESLTGWRAQGALGLPVDRVFQIVNELTRGGVESPVDRVIREGVIVGLANHTLLVARDGVERPIDDSGAPIRDGEGELMGVVLVFRDVSARRLAERTRERLVRSEAERDAAESASRAKDEFFAIVSHELRSPLAAAASWLELLRIGALSEGEEERALETIERNVRAQARLIDDLLDVSRIVSGKLTVERVPTDLGELVRSVLQGVRESIEAKHIAMRFEQQGLPIGSVDPERFRQVVSNLVSNAIKFTPDGGSILVSLAGDGDGIELSVRDSGRGIQPSFLPHVFDRFRQGEGVQIRTSGGLGLGLSIAKSLVERHGGTISAESEGEGLGASFRVRIPRADAAPLFSNAATGEAVMLHGLRVLLVEDHADSREALSHLLKRSGARVQEAASAEEAIDLFARERPEIVLSDIGMPQASGLSLIREIRNRDERMGIHTAAIAVTGFVSDQDRREALDAGFDEHVGKPIDADQLLATMQRILEEHSA
jgi:PAS domain S-box-containing protein